MNPEKTIGVAAVAVAPFVAANHSIRKVGSKIKTHKETIAITAIGFVVAGSVAAAAKRFAE